MKVNGKLVGAIAGVAVTGATVIAMRRRKTGIPPYGKGIKFKKAVTVNRPADELYRHWRNLESLPTLVPHLKSIDVKDGRTSTWRLSLPGGLSMRWEAEITVDRENDMIGWRSLPHSDIDLAGYIRFEPKRAGRETVVRVAMQYHPPVGRLGAAFASLLGERPGYLVEETLRRFKQLMETGELATGAAQPVTHFKLPETQKAVEPVQSASEDSFPASDPPAWTGTGV